MKQATATTTSYGAIGSSDAAEAPKSTFAQALALYLPILLPRNKEKYTDDFADEPVRVPSPAALEKAPENIYYLAYGSNLCAETFRGRRQIRPVSAHNVRVPTLALSFDLPGIAYLEPCFANVVVVETAGEGRTLLTPPGGGLIGVVYEVTPEDFATIIATEGGGAAYQDFVVEAFKIDGGEKLAVHTLLAPQEEERSSHAQPSRRYLDLIRAGAKEHGLPKEYREWLAELKEYRRTTWRQSVGAVVWAIMWMPLMVLVMSMTKVFAKDNGRAPGWMITVQKVLFKVMWNCYDLGFKTLFGNGERTEEDS
ncbi:hypothetical protein BZA05DRAFT_385155 [Tricharina praecox]|uniref:uncharacterized protein n=1 Tax=Tricharina praecox TaxID=43433 RepID=UPI00221F1CC3|nr:uncharacterized protein BZA05DRAFT_385155 [Tricharina praecox]KAI5857884.1 hypothetical protein BZA05DRAFT_385155 [Tricharina praecox]